MMPETALRSIEILLVEDSPTDALLTKEALAISKVSNTLHIATDGVEALAFLRQTGKYESAPRPDLILLDLNLPKKDGQEVLVEIKGDEKLKRIPVVVLTTSEEQKDIFESYGHHANCYIVKPVDFDKFVRVVKEIEGFWFSVVTLPDES
jgi:two-component system response regulator